ncbi:MAG: hypothetical protein O3A21_01045 [Proteobacteria bacterium]|nr:hypothetical protein [Pseudomonadota bacterium]
MVRRFWTFEGNSWLIASGVAAALLVAGAAGMAQSTKDDDLLLEDKGHLKIERPAKLSKEDAEKIYQRVGPRMARGYAAAGDPITGAFRKWRRYNISPYRSATHGNRYVNNYGNDNARPYGRLSPGEQMPAGAILVKDSFTVTADGDVFGGALFVMEKLPEGYEPGDGWLALRHGYAGRKPAR